MSHKRTITLVDGVKAQVRRGDVIRLQSGELVIVVGWGHRGGGWSGPFIRIRGITGVGHVSDQKSVREVLGRPRRASVFPARKQRSTFSEEVFPFEESP